jgi:uncharacterized protein YbjT (DUF2867 family)
MNERRSAQLRHPPTQSVHRRRLAVLRHGRRHPLQLVAGDDVGALAALAFDDPAAFSEPTELADDDLAMAEVAATFARVLGRPVQYVAMPQESAAQFDPGLATLGAPGWTARATGPTLGAFRRLRPGMLTSTPGCAAFAGQPTPPGTRNRRRTWLTTVSRRL